MLEWHNGLDCIHKYSVNVIIHQYSDTNSHTYSFITTYHTAFLAQTKQRNENGWVVSINSILWRLLNVCTDCIDESAPIDTTFFIVLLIFMLKSQWTIGKKV